MTHFFTMVIIANRSGLLKTIISVLNRLTQAENHSLNIKKYIAYNRN